MEHYKLWYQGPDPVVVPRCSGKPQFTCPESKRIAGEYVRGYYTLTNVLNPNIHYDGLGRESWLNQFLHDVKVGDYLWLVLVPPKHQIIDVFAYNEETTTEHSSLSSMGGISLSLVTATFAAKNENGDCPMSDLRERASLIMPTGDDAEEQFVHYDMGHFTGVRNWSGVGFKVDALPDGKTLADIVGKIVIGAHVVDYDAQTYM